MNFLGRKNSVKTPAAGTPAPDPAPLPSTTIPDVMASTEPLPLESLVPRDVVLKSITSTEVTVQYSLPPTSTKVGGPVDVKVLIRPSKIFKGCAAEESQLQSEMSKLQMEHNRKNAMNMGKPGFDHHGAFMELQAKTNPLRSKTRDIWHGYAAKCKELLPMNPEAQGIPFKGFYVVDLDQNICTPYEASTEVGIVSVTKSPETNTITIKNLASNIFYEVALAARRSNVKPTEGSAESAWSPLTTPVGFSTKTAPWQLALEKAGLRHLVEPFTVKGYDNFQSWMDITQEVKEELGIDAAADAVLGDILSVNGIITPAEQARIDRERTEMVGVVNTLLAELKETQDKLTTGDAVVEKVASNKKRGPRFGVVVAVNESGTECSVRWEDPRTKDPANSVVANNVKTSSVQRTQFTLFLSHAQADAQNQVAHLSVLLRDRDAKIWFDMDSERLEARDMVRGIANSKVVLLYLTRTYLDRYFCRMEASVAKALQKPVIIVYEPDERFGGTGDYVQLVNACTKKFPEFRDYLLSTEAVPMARRAFQRRAVVDEICKRAGLTSRTGSFSEKSEALGGSSSNLQSGMELADLRQMILDLKMEVNDLKAENQELKQKVETLLSE